MRTSNVNSRNKLIRYLLYPDLGSWNWLQLPPRPLRRLLNPLCSSLRIEDTMLRQALGRSGWRAGRQATIASRAFSATTQRNAEVELTIGEHTSLYDLDRVHGGAD
jgi:hypothetical protein